VPNALAVFTAARAVFGAAALVFNLHKYGIDPTLAAIARWVTGAEKTVATDAQKVYHAAAADLGEALARVAQLSAILHAAASAAVGAAKATASAPAAAPAPADPAAPAAPAVPLAPVPVAPQQIQPARAFLRWLNSIPLTPGNVAWLSAMSAADFGEWCAAAAAEPGMADTPGRSFGWLHGLSDEGVKFLTAVALASQQTPTPTDPR
jgi:hypothetical protein